MMFNGWTFLFEVLNFVVLAYVLHRLLYRPLREAIDRRREANARAQAQAEQARREAEALQQRLQAQLGSLDQQRQELIQQARAQADAERRKLLAAAEETAARRQAEVRQALEHERDEALRSLDRELAAQALELTERLLREAVDRSLHQQLALHLVQALEQLSDGEKSQVRTGWQAGDAPVLESADGLEAGTLRRLTEAVASIVGAPVAPAIEKRPELIGGVRLRLAGRVWDATLAGQLNAVAAAPVTEPLR